MRKQKPVPDSVLADNDAYVAHGRHRDGEADVARRSSSFFGASWTTVSAPSGDRPVRRTARSAAGGAVPPQPRLLSGSGGSPISMPEAQHATHHLVSGRTPR